MPVVSQLSNTAVCFMFHYNNQTDQGDETEGSENEGVKRLLIVKKIVKHIGSQCHLQLHHWNMWEMVHFRGPFPRLGFFPGFSLHIINFVGRISKAALGGVWGAQRPDLRINEPKKTVARSARAVAIDVNFLFFSFRKPSENSLAVNVCTSSNHFILFHRTVCQLRLCLFFCRFCLSIMARTLFRCVTVCLSRLELSVANRYCVFLPITV
jgi:hypothetical protein